METPKQKTPVEEEIPLDDIPADQPLQSPIKISISYEDSDEYAPFFADNDIDSSET